MKLSNQNKWIIMISTWIFMLILAIILVMAGACSPKFHYSKEISKCAGAQLTIKRGKALKKYKALHGKILYRKRTIQKIQR
jgi:hypothetical protein